MARGFSGRLNSAAQRKPQRSSAVAYRKPNDRPRECAAFFCKGLGYLNGLRTLPPAYIWPSFRSSDQTVLQRADSAAERISESQ